MVLCYPLELIMKFRMVIGFESSWSSLTSPGLGHCVMELFNATRKASLTPHAMCSNKNYRSNSILYPPPWSFTWTKRAKKDPQFHIHPFTYAPYRTSFCYTRKRSQVRLVVICKWNWKMFYFISSKFISQFFQVQYLPNNCYSIEFSSEKFMVTI